MPTASPSCAHSTSSSPRPGCGRGSASSPPICAARSSPPTTASRFRLQQRERGYNPQAPELGYDRSDFDASHNPTLAAVARATSAFPFAFEPRRIARADVEEKLYRPDEPAETWFADGGILNNEPFTTVETIIGRAADMPVDRWLVSVKPDPEHFGQPPVTEPEVDEVVSKALFGIPRYQSIAADLDRLNAHRARARREGDLLDELDARVSTLPEGWYTALDEAPIMGAYQAARRAQLYDDLGWAVAEAAGLEEAKAKVVAEALARAATAAELPDVSFERRRIYHLIKRSAADSPPPRRGPRRRSGPCCSACGRSSTGSAPPSGRRSTAASSSSRSPGCAASTTPSSTRAGRRARPGAARAAGRRAARPRDVGVRAARDLRGARPAVAGGACGERSQPHHRLRRLLALGSVPAPPVDPRLGIPARDTIRLARVSPRDAQYISVPAANKVAGDAVFHFGGFLQKEWRINDILWGRLDAAETVVRMVLAGSDADQAEVEAQIQSVQGEITAEELPEAGEDYRRYLEQEYAVGAETLADVPMQTRTSLVVGSSDVVRNMARGLASDPAHRLAGIYKWVGTVIGWVLALARWPVLAIWGDDPAARRAFSLVVLLVGAWAAVTIVLVAIGVVGASTTLWIMIAGAFGIFIVWSVLLAVFGGFKRALSGASARPLRW